MGETMVTWWLCVVTMVTVGSVAGQSEWDRCDQGPCRCDERVKDVVCFLVDIRDQVFPADTEILELTGVVTQDRPWQLPPDFFVNLTSVRILRLQLNQFCLAEEPLDPDILTPLVNAEDFWLSQNDIGACDILHEGIFRTNTKLLDLNLFGNQIEAIPPGMFDTLVDLEYLDFGDNKLTTLPTGSLNHLSKLAIFALSFNKVSHLPHDVFEGLSLLEQLYMSNNELSEFRPEWFTGLPNLFRLHIEYNPLEMDIVDRTFSELGNLEILLLGFNRLTTLRPGLLTGLDNLQNLYLDGNCYTELPENMFETTRFLQRLYLDDNILQPEGVRDLTFEGLDDLELIDFSSSCFLQAEDLPSVCEVIECRYSENCRTQCE